MSRSILGRLGGDVSRVPWCRRSTTPSAWNVTTVGIASGRAASWVAKPDIQ
ncbi:hypothetical protein QE397_002557 [Rhodococcus sp. SORGH_AS 301]|nr:hypothetical protein [Rhodococcus sp. SORGH_AS_0301]